MLLNASNLPFKPFALETLVQLPPRAKASLPGRIRGIARHFRLSAKGKFVSGRIEAQIIPENFCKYYARASAI